MQIITSISTLREALQATRSSHRHHSAIVGFVPTMGYLHEGHMSLVHEAKAQCDIVVMSIFVNPLQFLPHEDYERYPRDHERDCRLAQEAGVDFLFMPDRQEMYPQPTHTKIMISEVSDRAEGASRPGHFDGVATVVLKLFHIVQPQRAFLGLKDAQQVAVIEQMVKDLNIDIHIVACPIWRERDGLAMSSRNVYLNPEERQQALVISQALQQVQSYIEATHQPDPEHIIRIATEHIQSAPLARIDYVQVWAYPSFQPLTVQDEQCILAIAVKFSQTRLIDNLVISLGRPTDV